MKKILALLIVVLAFCPQLSKAQTQRNPCYYTTQSPGPENGCIPVSSATPLPITNAGTQYPSGAIPVVAVGTGSTGAVTATLPANATLKTYICGIDISALGGTAAVSPITITNVNGTTFTYQLASTASGNNFFKTFSPCIPTSAINTAMVATTTADATATAVDINIQGYQAP